MKRRHTRQDVISLCDQIQNIRPEVAFGADLITGFPTETDKSFDETVKLVAESELTYLHVFPFSPRPKTPAAKMPQIKRSVIKRRAAILREIGAKSRFMYFKKLNGKVETVLVEKNNRGYTETFAPVRLLDNVNQGEIVSVLINKSSPDGLTGTATKDLR